jgi:2-succinyl-6-hydroxy-2,4-cyclohexadiene-1-carboxylate synthase
MNEADVLAHESIGQGTPALTFVHGFTQTRESWRPLASRFATTRRVSLVDLPGHGSSVDVPEDLDQAGRLLAAVSANSVIVGYSMGARVALHAALSGSDRLLGLVLTGAHLGIQSPDERAKRRDADEALARRIEQIGVDRFVKEWLDQPMFAGVRHLSSSDRLLNSAHGLAGALRRLGTGTQLPLDERLSSLDLPVLLLVGDKDTKFIEQADRMARRVDGAQIALIAGAGHACHLEQPEETFSVVDEWLGSLREK